MSHEHEELRATISEYQAKIDQLSATNERLQTKVIETESESHSLRQLLETQGEKFRTENEKLIAKNNKLISDKESDESKFKEMFNSSLQAGFKNLYPKRDIGILEIVTKKCRAFHDFGIFWKFVQLSGNFDKCHTNFD